MQYNTLTRCAVCVCVTSALLLACVKVVMHFASSALRRLGLVSDSCRVALGLRVFPRLTLTVRASDVALTDYAIDVLSGLIAPYCALRITAVLLTAVEVEVAVTEVGLPCTASAFLPRVKIALSCVSSSCVGTSPLLASRAP